MTIVKNINLNRLVISTCTFCCLGVLKQVVDACQVQVKLITVNLLPVVDSMFTCCLEAYMCCYGVLNMLCYKYYFEFRKLMFFTSLQGMLRFRFHFPVWYWFLSYHWGRQEFIIGTESISL